MTEGTVRDIRTGRAIGRTKNMSETFVRQCTALLEDDQDIYIVTGRCQHLEMRDLVDELRTMGITVISDKKFPAECMFLFSGTPDELGFAS